MQIPSIRYASYGTTPNIIVWNTAFMQWVSDLNKERLLFEFSDTIPVIRITPTDANEFQTIHVQTKIKSLTSLPQVYLNYLKDHVSSWAMVYIDKDTNVAYIPLSDEAKTLLNDGKLPELTYTVLSHKKITVTDVGDIRLKYTIQAKMLTPHNYSKTCYILIPGDMYTYLDMQAYKFIQIMRATNGTVKLHLNNDTGTTTVNPKSRYSRRCKMNFSVLPYPEFDVDRNGHCLFSYTDTPGIFTLKEVIQDGDYVKYKKVITNKVAKHNAFTRSVYKYKSEE